MQTGFQLQHLFVTILHECTPARPRELWDKFWHDICDDLKHQLQQQGMQDPSDALIQDYGLYLIDRLLSYTGKRLHDWDSMPQFVQDWGGGT